MLLDGCKWDPQVGDVATLAPFPLLIRRGRWEQIRGSAESLAAETARAERELASRPELHRVLAVPRRVRSALRAAHRRGASPAVARVMRFDFHWTTDGWRVSEVNSDVPGGFAEASDFPRRVAACVPGARPAGDPAAAWCDAVATAAGGGTVALLAAPGFMEDQQVVAYLARRLAERGPAVYLARPEQLEWRDGCALLRLGPGRIPLAAVVRFYQAEWLAKLPRRCWWNLFAAGRTPVTNAGAAVLTESKRFPLVWDELAAPLPTWRRLLPESQAPRRARGATTTAGW